MIINIRGTNGSGKSTLVKTLMNHSKFGTIYGVLGPKRPEAYRLGVGVPPEFKRGVDVYVVGPYQTATGGIDALSSLSSQEIVTLLEKYRKQGHVLFEGAIISTFMGAIGEWLLEHKSEAIVAFMDTPLEKCLQGLAERQSGHRGTAHVESKYNTMLRLREKMNGLGLRTELVSREKGLDQIRWWLK